VLQNIEEINRSSFHQGLENRSRAYDRIDVGSLLVSFSVGIEIRPHHWEGAYSFRLWSTDDCRYSYYW